MDRAFKVCIPLEPPACRMTHVPHCAGPAPCTYLPGWVGHGNLGGCAARLRGVQEQGWAFTCRSEVWVRFPAPPPPLITGLGKKGVCPCVCVRCVCGFGVLPLPHCRGCGTTTITSRGAPVRVCRGLRRPLLRPCPPTQPPLPPPPAHRDMCPRGGMRGASPQSHSASGWRQRHGGIISGLPSSRNF